MGFEQFIRLGAFFGIFALMAVCEAVYPRKKLATSKPVRWLGNLSITFINTLVIRLVFPAAAVGVALSAADNGRGLFNLIDINPVIEGILCVVILDLLIYAQHVAFHHITPFWRLHMMHHADMDIDVTTGVRFHPVEIILSMLIKMAVVYILGAPVWSIVAFEVILNGMAMFNHANVKLPLAVDKIVRKAVVTPDMHRVHHSVIIRETNSNYGFNLSIWDRLFGTYIAQPQKGHEEMKIGLANFRDPGKLTLPYMMTIPLMGRDR